jgi:CheY-like chemotaxis protein
MVYGIVKQSGGYINFESAPGKGTIFRIILPTVPDGDAPEQSAPDGPAASGLETILLVEDEAAVRGIALRALKEAGHTVLEASSGEEALRRAAAHEGAIDLLLSDVVMPGMDGWQLSERFAQLYPDTKILHMSGYTDKAALHRELEAPGANFLQKPFTPAGLVRKIRQVLDTPARNARPPSGTRTI